MSETVPTIWYEKALAERDELKAQRLAMQGTIDDLMEALKDVLTQALTLRLPDTPTPEMEAALALLRRIEGEP